MSTPLLQDLTEAERDELRAIFKSVPDLHHMSFEQCIADRVYLICLWNVNRARKKVRARAAAAAEHFQLVPPS